MYLISKAGELLTKRIVVVVTVVVVHSTGEKIHVEGVIGANVNWDIDPDTVNSVTYTIKKR